MSFDYLIKRMRRLRLEQLERVPEDVECDLCHDMTSPRVSGLCARCEQVEDPIGFLQRARPPPAHEREDTEQDLDPGP